MLLRMFIWQQTSYAARLWLVRWKTCERESNYFQHCSTCGVWAWLQCNPASTGLLRYREATRHIAELQLSPQFEITFASLPHPNRILS